MHSFIHLPECPVVICKECQFGVSIEGIYTTQRVRSTRMCHRWRGWRGKGKIYHGLPGYGASGFFTKGLRVGGLRSIEERSQLERKRVKT